jgi:hypothetical protein
MRDLPWQGRQVEIHLQARRFRCRNKECLRKIFAESLSAVAARKARQTMRLCEMVGLVGYALGGSPGERLLNRLGIKGSGDLFLPPQSSRRFRGLKKNHNHLRAGFALVNLSQHRKRLAPLGG